MNINGKYCIFIKKLKNNNFNNEQKEENNLFFDSFNLNQIEQQF